MADSTVGNKVTHHQRLRWREDFLTAKASELDRAKRDRLYYDHQQWTSVEIEDHKKRGQPVITYNRIQPKINFILGHEVRTRVDPTALPRTPQHEDCKGAVTDALQFVDDDTEFDVTRSFCTEDQLIQGCMAVALGIEETAEGARNRVFTRRIKWANFWYDPASTEPDFSDAKYKATHQWWDLDDAIAEFANGDDGKEVARLLDECVQRDAENEDSHNRDTKGMWVSDDRKRLVISECYWTEGGVWYGAMDCLAGEIIPAYVVPWTDDTEEGKNWCPIEATSCYVVQEDNEDGMESTKGERYGVVRGMIAPQDEINHRRSRALHDLSEHGAIAEETAIPNEKKFITDLATPGTVATVREGALRDGSLEIRKPGEIAQGDLLLLQEAKAEIDNVGPSLPVTAGDNSVMSGRAILAKQQIGSMELERPFDNVRQWQRRVFKKWWWLIRDPELGWNTEDWLRVRDSKQKEGYRFVPINRRMTRAQRAQDLMSKDVPFEQALQSVALPPGAIADMVGQVQQMLQQQAATTGEPPDPAMLQQMVLSHPLMQEEYVENQLAQLTMDIIISEVPDTTIAAQEETMELMNLGQKVPALGANPGFVKALIRNSNLRGKDELLESMDQKPDPQQVMIQQAAMQAQMQHMQAQIQELVSRAELNKAKTAAEMADAEKTTVEAQVGIPAEAQKDQAAAVERAAEAGSKTLPD